MRISARADYAVRAALDLAQHFHDGLRSAEAIADRSAIPASFLETILTALRKAGVVESKRGARGGYRLAQDPAAISVADIIRAVDGPLVFVRDERPSDMDGGDTNPSIMQLWVALRASVRKVLDDTTLAHLAAGEFPSHVVDLLNDPASWANARLAPEPGRATGDA